MTTATPLRFELKYRREAYNVVRGRLERDTDKKLPAVPPQFSPLTGDWPTVSARATELNAVQERSGFLHYFFFPEVAGLSDTADPKHCATCKRIYDQD